jgi:hypothetical protein
VALGDRGNGENGGVYLLDVDRVHGEALQIDEEKAEKHWGEDLKESGLEVALGKEEVLVGEEG